MISREFLFKYYPDVGDVEMYDLKHRRHFLKKSPGPTSLQLRDLYVGSQIVIHSRVLKIVECSDEYTREAIGSSRRQTSVAVVTPDATANTQRLGSVLSKFEEKFALKHVKMAKLTSSQAQECAGLLGRDDDATTRLLASGPCVFLAVCGEDAIQRLLDVCDSLGANGPERSASAAPSAEAANELVDFAFGSSRQLAATARYGPDCACCVIRPHAVADGHCGSIIGLIPFEISAMELFKLDEVAAAEFLEVYDGVVPHYQASIQHLAIGPCLALELQGPNCVAEFRRVCGPWDVDFAKELRPDSIRAKFGEDTVQNAVHCTDLPEDGELESKYFFQILQT